MPEICNPCNRIGVQEKPFFESCGNDPRTDKVIVFLDGVARVLGTGEFFVP